MFKCKEKQRLVFLLFIVLILTIILTSYKAYITIRCMDLNYSANYNLTSTTLQRIKSQKIVFLNNDTAVLNTSGLCTQKPYKTINVTALLRRDKFGVWYLASSSVT